ncbi:MAG: UDP-N-acetylglucosamine--N-acetylmuramyl-(pentapeptide) pyrophosphoryl-undecaprenol N-acetylglucosamine transferase [Clostridia bacterium]|nr:UDP-N-acetylglucosamine--N-acetylmuramyl-(pentapeptide) pyrophosphoryl-undecaprenol N-acetylglucosamine transferase [Clostridia bacterium]
MRVLLCGGGTAGHVNPALAIAETIKRNCQNAIFAYIATEKGIENKLVPYPKYIISARGLKKSLLSNIKTVYYTVKSISQCKKIIKDFSPDLVIGTGGYSCYPVIRTASKMGIKTAIHESNAYPGKSTRMMSKYADVIFINYAESKKYFEGKNVVVCGIPFLQSFLNSAYCSTSRRKVRTVLCFGGSLGAEKMNECALLIAKSIENRNIKLIWGCGVREYSKCKQELKNAGLHRNDNIELRDYIDNMAEVLDMVDIVICRAGAISIAEMAYNRKCTVFIPSPNVTDNHQYKNAKILADKGASYLVEEENISEVPDIVNMLLNDDKKRNELSNKIAEFCIRDSNKIIYREIKKLMDI